MTKLGAAVAPYDAVVLLGFGGPSRPEEIRPFLDRVLSGRPVSSARYDEVVRHYLRIGGSPYNRLTQQQADALASHLRERGISTPVLVAYRNAAPFVDDVVADLVKRGANDVFCIVLAPHQSAASWQKYVAGFERARLNAMPPLLRAQYVDPYFDHPLFLRAHAERIEDALKTLGRTTFDGVELVFTAHSIPLSVFDADLYVRQFRRTAELLAAALGAQRWSLAYQSRSGSPSDPWLEPDVRDVLRSMPSRGITETVVAPIGFLCDHVEVRYDLDVDAREAARSAGVRMARAQSLNDHPLFAAMLAELTTQAMLRRAAEAEGE